MAGTRRLGELADRVRAQVGVVPAGCVAVAISGGADSAVAAWLMIDLGLECRGIHVDHGLDGSPVMSEAAVAIATRLEIDLEIMKTEVPNGASPENQARMVRYRALQSALRNGEQLVTGHTRDDQAETVLLNVLRGSGLDGLAGIPRHRGRIVRPLLSVSRSETRELATLLNLPWRDDSANEDPDPRRNQLRRTVIPELERRFNPQLRSTLASLAEMVSGELPARPHGVQIREVEGGVVVAAPELHAVGPATASQALRDAMRLVRGPHAGTRSEIGRLLAVAEGLSAAAEVEGGIRAYRSGPWLMLDRSMGDASPPHRQWTVPGGLRFGDWNFESWVEDRPPVAMPLASWVAVADSSLYPSEPTVRLAEPGDSMDGVPVAERLRRLGIPPDQRSNWPVVESENLIVWIPGAGISRAVWVGPTTRRYLWVHAAMETS